jgi:hypothetical protein
MASRSDVSADLRAPESRTMKHKLSIKWSLSRTSPHFPGAYYIVLDNTYSIGTDKFCCMTVQKTTP